MRKADFQARIKKIEIVNKVLADGWAQSIRVNLDDIELTNENLLELRQFRPNEPVNVIIKSAELNLLDMGLPQTRDSSNPNSINKISPDGRREEDEDFITIAEDDGDELPPGKVVREFKI
jgi:hypothetical protein